MGYTHNHLSQHFDYKHFTKPNQLAEQQNWTRKSNIYNMNITTMWTSNRKSLLNEGRPKKDSFKLEVLKFNNYLCINRIMCILCTPLTDMSVHISIDISSDTRPTYQLTYRPSVDRFVGTHLVEYRSICRPMSQKRYQPSDDQHINRLSADISVDVAADTWPVW